MEALKDDYPLEGAYSDHDSDSVDDWTQDDTQWTEDDPGDANDNVKDESSAYLEFLNEEVSLLA